MFINIWKIWDGVTLIRSVIFIRFLPFVPSITLIWVLLLLVFGQRGHRYFYLERYLYSAPESNTTLLLLLLQISEHSLALLGKHETTIFKKQ